MNRITGKKVRTVLNHSVPAGIRKVCVKAFAAKKKPRLKAKRLRSQKAILQRQEVTRNGIQRNSPRGTTKSPAKSWNKSALRRRTKRSLSRDNARDGIRENTAVKQTRRKELFFQSGSTRTHRSHHNENQIFDAATDQENFREKKENSLSEVYGESLPAQSVLKNLPVLSLTEVAKTEESRTWSRVLKFAPSDYRIPDMDFLKIFSDEQIPERPVTKSDTFEDSISEDFALEGEIKGGVPEEYTEDENSQLDV